MNFRSLRGVLIAACAAGLLSGGAAQAVQLATLDTAQFATNGFAFADFNDNFFGNFDASGDFFQIDTTADLDGNNGFFGGAGANISADFEAATTQLEVVFAVGADNAANSFGVTLIDNDGVNTAEAYQYSIDLTNVSPVDGFVTQTLPLDSFVFRQAAFGQADGDMELNFGLTGIQFQSVFGGADRLQVDIERISLVDPNATPDPTLFALTPESFNATFQNFTFGTFSDAGVVDDSGDAFVIDTTQSPDDGQGGGLGITGLNFDFDAEDYVIEVEARLLPNNQAESFNLLAADLDGDDSGPGLGSENFIFTVPTSEFNETELTTFTIPLGSGSEDLILTSFGFENGGDGLQNFDLTALQIQANGDESGVGAGLAIEIARFAIVLEEALAGDFNGDGIVNTADYAVFRDSIGLDESVLDGAGDGSGVVDEGDFDLWVANFGATAGDAPAASAVSTVAVPEPTMAALMAVLAAAGFCRRPTA